MKNKIHCVCSKEMALKVFLNGMIINTVNQIVDKQGPIGFMIVL